VTIFLIGLNIILYGYVLISGTLNLVIRRSDHQALVNQLPQNLVTFEQYRADNQPVDVQVLSTDILLAGEGRYDLVARLKNLNNNWAVLSFDYKFVVNGAETETQTGWMLPGEEKYITDLAVTSTQAIRSFNIDFSNITWRRITDYEEFASTRLGIEIEDVEFIAPQPATEGKPSLSISRVSFTANNRSAFSFWQVDFVVVLLRGTRVVGVNQITLDQLISGQRRPVEVSWFEQLPQVNSVIVEPHINILDPSVFMTL